MPIPSNPEHIARKEKVVLALRVSWACVRFPALLIFFSHAMQHIQFNVFESIHSIVQSSSQSYFKTFHLPQEKPQCFASHSPFPPCPAPGHHSPTSVSPGFPFLDILYKWNQTLCSLLCPASFTWHEVFKVHPHCGMNVLYF